MVHAVFIWSEQAKGMAWGCSQLYNGASCRMRDDWVPQMRRREGSLMEKKRKEMADDRLSSQQVIISILPQHCLHESYRDMVQYSACREAHQLLCALLT